MSVLRTIEELVQLLKLTPAMAEVEPLSLAYLPEEILVHDSTEGLVALLDSPYPQPEQMLLSTECKRSYSHRMPMVAFQHEPLSAELNSVLLRRYDQIASAMVCQSQVPEVICQSSRGDCVILVIADGLSFEDWRRSAPSQMVDATRASFVDGHSDTVHGFLRIIGQPTLATRLAACGYIRSYGFSYWDRTEKIITDSAFSGVTEGVRKMRSMQEAIDTLPELQLESTYVQIVRNALDGVAHRHRDRPAVGPVVEQLANEILQIEQLIRARGLSGTVHMTSDHGILWRDSFCPEFVSPEGGDAPPRHYKGLQSGSYTHIFTEKDSDYTALAYPFLRREARANEWGFHGGLSFEECVVPLMTIEVKTDA